MVDPPARTGQVWQSRRDTRRVLVTAVVDGYAEVVRVDARSVRIPGSRPSRIRLDHSGRLPRYRCLYRIDGGAR